MGNSTMYFLFFFSAPFVPFTIQSLIVSLLGRIGRTEMADVTFSLFVLLFSVFHIAVFRIMPGLIEFTSETSFHEGLLWREADIGILLWGLVTFLFGVCHWIWNLFRLKHQKKSDWKFQVFLPPVFLIWSITV
jgi:hypothetical protein